MYSPTLRLLALLELLETHGTLSGSDIARRLEVDPRTVRRYIVSLQDMGIPVAGERGPAGSYRLERGSRLPPLIFNDSEASAVVLGLVAMRELDFPLDAASVEGALAKTERLLPERVLGYVNELREGIRFHHPGRSRGSGRLRSDLVQRVGQAIQRRQRLVLTYRSMEGSTTRRSVDVYGLVLVASQWYAVGHCHLRAGLRVFRVDRMVDVETTEERFDRPVGFDALGHVLDALERAPQDFEVEVVLETTLENARLWLASEVRHLEPIAGGVLYRLSTSRLDWVARGLLAVDAPLTIRRPAELYEEFQRLARRASRVTLGPSGVGVGPPMA